MIRSDLALALSTGWPPAVVAGLDDRDKTTLWELLEDLHDRRKEAADGS